MPHGVPLPVLVVLVPIEIISFLSRPVSLSVRLFANILAGHITLAVFGGFVVMLLGGRRLGGARARADPRDRRALCAGAARRLSAGVRLQRPHLRLSQRRNSPGPLINIQQ